MSNRTYSRFLVGALVAGAIPFAYGAALAQAPAAAPQGHHSPMFSQMDADKDGKVSRAEAEAFNKARAAEVDANKDGKVTAAEMKAYMDKQRDKRMAERLARLDTDGDGSVSVQEFQDAGTWRAARMDRNGDGVIDGKDRRSMRGDRHRAGDHGHSGHR